MAIPVMDGNWTRAMDEEIWLSTNGKRLTVCLKLPPKLDSDGIWGRHSSNPSLLKTAVDSHFPLLELQMLLIFAVSIFIHFFSKRVGLPVIVSQIIAGFIIGPSSSITGNFKILQRLEEWKEQMFYIGSQDVMATTAVYGYILFLFLIGVRMDPSMMKKTGKKALIIGILCLVAPSVFGFMAASFFSRLLGGKNGIEFHFLVATRSSTSLMVVACLLDHLQLLNSELGRLGLSSALISELFGVTLSTISNLFRTGKQDGFFTAFMLLAALISFFVVIVFVVRPAMFWVVKHTPEGQQVDNLYIVLIVFLVFVSGLMSELMGQTMIFGPFILGLAVPEGPPLGSTLASKLDGFISSTFLPLFVCLCAIKADLGTIGEGSFVILGMYVSLMCVTFLSKVVVCLGTGMYCRLPFSDSLALGLMMSGRGIVELAIYSFVYDSNLINDFSYALLVLDVLVISIAVPIGVKWLYNPSKKYAGYQKRSIISMKPNSELRILGCIHARGDVKILTNFIDVLCLSRESSISLYALHLIELIGRTSPIFISHQLQVDCADRPITSYMIHTLGAYKRNNQRAISVEVFTAISPPKLMHEDVCILALNKLTSIIILPFHQKWSLDLSIESEDAIIQALNCRTMERAPCSVGILIDRGHFAGLASSEASTAPFCRVAMIFIGGPDDREAVSFVKRMNVDSGRVQVSIIRLIAEETTTNEWDRMLDSQVLQEVKAKFDRSEDFQYIEKLADEGAKTALIVQSIENNFDFIVVGRRYGIESPQTSGMKEWSEFPELGVLGDMLATNDVGCYASVLVVQQQQLAY